MSKILEKYDQNNYKHFPLGFSKFSGNNWCAICSTAYSISQKFDIEVYPETLNELLKQHNGYLKESAYLKWGILEKIFPALNINTHLFSCAHHNPSIVGYYDIISVDGMKREGYQSHFISIVSSVLDEDYNVIDFKIFDPYYCDIINLTERYNKGNLTESIYSIINLSRRQP